VKNVQDRFFHQAKREGYAARSVYKLQEIDERYRLFQPETTILDVGSAPGSWLQFIHRRLKGQVRLYGIDLQQIGRAHV
jgi:23S rRNA (uridine2552-2'-O)-methyltransferase